MLDGRGEGIAVFCQKIYGPLTHLVVGQPDSRKRRIEVGRNQLYVVEANHGNIVGYGTTEFAKRIIGAHRHGIVETEDCRWGSG